MADNYLGFTFDGVRIALEDYGTLTAKTYDGFIINSGDDLKFSSAPEFSSEFASPTLGDYSIYTGTTVGSKMFSFRIALKENSYADFQAILKWLGPEEKGYLIFDYNEDFGYEVKVNSIGSASYVVQSDGITYNIEFDIEFITTGDWAAYELTSNDLPTTPKGTDITNKSSFNLEWDTNDILITNNSKIEQYFILDFNGPLDIVLPDAAIVSVLNPDSEAMKYYSQYGIIINTVTNQFVSGTINPYAVPADAVEKRITGDADVTDITILSRQII